MSIIVIFLVAISLSMDAFSLSLAYGMIGLTPKNNYIISISVGILHFLMPIIGIIFGTFLLKILPFSPQIIAGLTLIGLGIEMVYSQKNNEVVKEMTSIFSILLFALSVSIDSLVVGINLKLTNTNIYLASTIFMLVSGVFTYLGLKLGKKINIALGNISTIIGGIILIILGLFYLK